MLSIFSDTARTKMHLLVIIYLTLITVCGESSWKSTSKAPHSAGTRQTVAETTEVKKIQSSSGPSASSPAVSTSSSPTSSTPATPTPSVSDKSTSTTTSSTSNRQTTPKDIMSSSRSKTSLKTATSPSPPQKDTTRLEKGRKLTTESAGRLDATTTRDDPLSKRTSDEPNIKLWYPSAKTSTRETQDDSSSSQMPTVAKGTGISMNRGKISTSEDDEEETDTKRESIRTRHTSTPNTKESDASRPNTTESDAPAPTGTTTDNTGSLNTKQVTKTNSDSMGIRQTTRPSTEVQHTAAKVRDEEVESAQSTTKQTVTSKQTVTKSKTRQATSPTTSQQTVTRSAVNKREKKTRAKRLRKRKKKTMSNTAQPKIQIHSIDGPQPMPMLMSPAGRSDVKKKKRVNKKAANRGQGARGPKGEKGDRGEKGEMGPPGPPANATEDLPEIKLQAAATAVLTDHFGPDKNVIIPFDLKLIDLADNYDNSSGVFMTSIPGIYVISLYLMSHPGAKVNARIFINNRPVAALWADDSKNAGFYPSSSIQTISKLSFGDQVYVMLVDGGYGESWVHANYNAFSLYLLYEELFF